MSSITSTEVVTALVKSDVWYNDAMTLKDLDWCKPIPPPCGGTMSDEGVPFVVVAA